MAIGEKNLVSKDFWLNIGAEVVYNSLQARKDAVDRLQRTIVWVFGVYTSMSFASVIFSDKKTWVALALVLFAAALVFLILGYWVATLAAFSAPEDFYGSAEESIRNAFNKAVKKSSRNFNRAVALSGTGAVLYSIALAIQIASPAWFKPPVAPASNPGITVNGARIPSKGLNYHIQLNSKKSAWHQVFLVHDSTNGKKTVTDTLLPDKNSKFKQLSLFTDTAGIARFDLKDLQYLKGNALVISRTDSTKGNENFITQRIRFVLK